MARLYANDTGSIALLLECVMPYLLGNLPRLLTTVGSGEAALVDQIEGVSFEE